MFCHTSLFTFVPCYDERDTITILKTYYFMKKNYLTELCKEDEEVEGSLLMLAKLLASKELGKQFNLRNLYKRLRQQNLLPEAKHIHISFVVNQFSGRTDCMMMDNHGCINNNKELV